MRAVPAGTSISSILVARNCRSTLERREKSGILPRSSILVVTGRSFAWSASYHAPRYWFAVAWGAGALSSRVYKPGLEGMTRTRRVHILVPGNHGEISVVPLNERGKDHRWP